MEVDSDSDKTFVSYNANNMDELGQPNVEEFQINDEEQVQVKKPISSTKAKSLENINKITNRALKKKDDKALIELYKKHFQIKESNGDKEHTRNVSSGMKPITKVTTIDLTKVFNFTNGSNGSHHTKTNSTHQKTNFIKKNINYISELNMQL